MSETTTPTRSAGDSRRRRSRGGRRRRNRNNNQNQNQNQDQRNHGQQRSRGQRKRREPKPEPLTWWQKLLKSVGLYTPKSKPAAKSRSKAKPKSNTRVASGRTAEPKAEPAKPVAATATATAPPETKVETPRLYVGNLSYDATEPDLEELFKGFGSVRSIEIVYNRRTHRSKGYAFVVMHHLDDARRAVEVLHDQPFMGRKLIVNGAVSDGPSDSDDSDDSDDDSDN